MSILGPRHTLHDGDHLVIGASFSTATLREHELWFRLDARFEADLCSTADPFLLGVLLRSMWEGEDLHVDGPVTSGLLANLHELQLATSRISSRGELASTPFDYRVVAVTVEEEVAAGPRPPEAITAFSGGVDSAFTAFRHLTGRTPHPLPISAGLFVHGFDIPLEQESHYDGALARSRRMLDPLGIELVPVATNLRTVEPNWLDLHAFAIAGALTLLGGRFGTGLIPGTVPYERTDIARGSSALTDWLLGSDGFRVVHDGAGFDRVDKARLLTEWPDALDHLRFCYEGDRGDENCGRCRKCVKTYLIFRSVGAELTCFEDPVGPDAIETVMADIGGGPVREYFSAILLESADAAGLDEPWVADLRREILGAPADEQPAPSWWRRVLPFG